MASQGLLLSVENVVKSFPAPSGAADLAILNGVSFKVQAGESLAIVGPSGSGKSTLLHIIGTLDRPSRGEVVLDGATLGKLDEAQLAWTRNRQIGFVFQSHYLLPHCTVLENVLVPSLANVSSGAKGPIEAGDPEPRARRLLQRVGLADRLLHRPGQLSGGERQRVAVVRALINSPRLLLADEPTGSLDTASATELGQLLVDLKREEQVALIVVTHSVELAKLMDRVLRLTDGHLQEVAP